jgi:signal peptidase
MKLNILCLGESRWYRILVITYLFFIFLVVVFSASILRNIHSFTNISDSMSPAINTGSITIVKQFKSYEIGDMIAYYTDANHKEIITHRVVSIGGNVYTTKGDANQVADREIVLPRLVIGRAVLVIPYLGHLIRFTKSQFGSWLLIIFPAIVIILIELSKIYYLVKQKTRR